MTAKVAYDTYNGEESGLVNFEFDWYPDFPAEDANFTQIHVVVKEGLYKHLDTKEPIRAMIILDGDAKDLIDSI